MGVKATLELIKNASWNSFNQLTNSDGSVVISGRPRS